MTDPKKAITYILLKEGQDGLDATIKLAVEACYRSNIRKLVIFTASGRGVDVALELQKPEDPLSIAAVSFPKDFKIPAGAVLGMRTRETKERIEKLGVKVIEPAVFPFSKLIPGEWKENPYRQALSTISGGFVLTTQAILSACDEGFLEPNQYAVGVSADTAIIARSSTTENFPNTFVVREILVKPFFLNLTKGEEPQISTGPLQPK